MASGNEDTNQVLVEENKFSRTLILNRPRQLNALSREMVARLLKLFNAYKDDPSVKLVIVKGQGRAFSAGGDVAAVVHDITKGHWRLGAKYFYDEFSLNYIMATYSKPQVFAMPETALGLFPDVGASYFLSRLPGFFGEYVGLTGARLDGAEMLACGLATHFVPAAKLDSLEEALLKVDTTDTDTISAIVDEFSERPPLKEKSAYNSLNVIERCFSRRTTEEILFSLEREAVDKADSWVSAAIQSLKKASPMSLKISLRSIREGRLQGVGQCLAREYRMVCHVLRREVSKDFFEGCRAILLDKDRNPKWEPSSLELIRDEMVNRYFSKVDDKDWEDLKLPLGSNLPSSAVAKL